MIKNRKKEGVMNIKKIALTVFPTVIALSLIAASVLPATGFRIKEGETASFNQGRAGVTFTDSRFSGIVRLARPDDSRIKAVNHPDFKYSLLEVRFNTSDGAKVRYVVGAVYVYFLLKQSDLRDWEHGELALYMYDSWGNQWKECPAFLVTNHGSRPRLACRIRTFSVYGLAETSLEN
jgi:hypothetical protein